MTVRTGTNIGPYRILQEFTGGANCNWTFARLDGADFFVKEFHRPKYPPETMTGKILADKLKRCRDFEARHKRLIKAMSEVSAPGGNIVMPANFFRLGLMYYHIAPRVEVASMSPAQIAALPALDRLVLLRLLARSVLALHSKRIVHGDLKPSNILIHRSTAGVVSPKLIDFDGSFFHAEPPDQADMAFDQSYMAPEILAYNKPGGGGVKAADLGTPADVFSVGVLLHEFWTGRRPALDGGHLYAAEAARAGAAIRVDMPGAYASLEDATRQALAVEPGARPGIDRIDQVIGAALTALRGGEAKPGLHAPTPSEHPSGPRIRFGPSRAPASPAPFSDAARPPPPSPDPASGSRIRFGRMGDKPATKGPATRKPGDPGGADP